MTNNNNKKINLLSDLIYLSAILVISHFCFNLFSWMAINLDACYQSDVDFYVRIAVEGPLNPSRLINVIFWSLYRLTGTETSLIVFLAAVVALTFISNHLYIHYFSGCNLSDTVVRFVVHALSIAVVFAGPIYVPGIHRSFYKDTFAIYAWHSPTQVMLTLFSILGTLYLFKMLDEYEESINVKWWLAASFFFLLSAGSKPSYIIDIIPALIIAFLIELFIKSSLGFGEKFKRLFIIGLSFVPSGIYMLYLNYYIYKRPDRRGDSSILVNPDKFAENPHFAVAICCCMAFSLFILIFNYKKIATDRRYRIILFIAIMGFLQWGLLGESGAHSTHGNFEWGCIIGGYMLVLTSAAILVNNYITKDFLGNKKVFRFLYFSAALGLLALHLISHIYYFHTMYLGFGYWR